MKTRIASGAAALSLLLALPLFAKAPASKMSSKTAPKVSKMDPANIGNVSPVGQSLRYKRPAKRGLSKGSPSNMRNVSRTEQSLRYKGPGKSRSSKKR